MPDQPRVPRQACYILDFPILVWEAMAWSGNQPSPPMWAEVVTYVVWAAFAADLIIRLCLTESATWPYLRKYWFDVLIVVLPMLRIVRLLRLIRFARSLLYLGRALKVMRKFMSAGFVKKVVTVISMAIASATSVVWLAERAAEGSDIKSFWDALWWSICTITTVGYGDLYPVTVVGRSVAIMLMLVGISTFGVLTANIAAFLMADRRTPTCPHCGHDLANGVSTTAPGGSDGAEPLVESADSHADAGVR